MAKKASDAIKDIAKTVTDAAEPYIEMAKEKGGPVIEEMKEKAEPAIDVAKKNAGPYIKKAKEQGTKAADKVRAATKDLTDASAKKNQKTEFFVQYKDYEIRTEDIAQKIREIYIADGHKASDIKELQVYLKPEENTAYYVVNHKDTGKFTY
ncbi:DUF6465 family protein [Butyrivibrio sp. AE3006]|uniref:DUF6465 family protein n=1 Tax=Butyrivibrio sp. AE3006 TaxID=1280673 RepID=UPI0004012E91|nr:DUF6465 family protein [Butyrivibrio sp. AE3006]